MVVSSSKAWESLFLYDLNKAEGVPNPIIVGLLIFILMIINKILTQFLVWCRGLQGLSGRKIVGENQIKTKIVFILPTSWLCVESITRIRSQQSDSERYGGMARIDLVDPATRPGEDDETGNRARIRNQRSALECPGPTQSTG
ncbi:MAG: hypothetical protein ABTR27_10755, partial [Candidatus Competibacter phosphatis]